MTQLTLNNPNTDHTELDLERPRFYINDEDLEIFTDYEDLEILINDEDEE